MKKICFITTVSTTLKAFIMKTAEYLHENTDWDISFICSDDPEFEESLPDYISYFPVHMERGISVAGIKAMLQIKKIFKKEKFDLIQYSTPNASFYASIAGMAARIPVRIYAQWGIRYVGLSGFSRKIFKMLEKCSCMFSTDIRGVSRKNRQFSIDERLCKASKIKVLGEGGTIGVDLSEYDLSRKTEYRDRIREMYRIPKDAFVYGYIGRLNRDKGTSELIEAFQKADEDTYLLMIGKEDQTDPVPEKILKWAKDCQRVVLTGPVPQNKVPQYLAAIDVHVHPTYREGFGKVIQEAMAMELPVITTDIPGPSEVIEENISGLLVPAKDSDALCKQMVRLKNSPKLCNSLAAEGRKRAEIFFERTKMLQNILNDYNSLLGSEEKIHDEIHVANV